MEDLSKKTPTELLKMANDTKAEHESLKKKIIDQAMLIEEMEKKIDAFLKRIGELESQYVLIMEEIDKK